MPKYNIDKIPEELKKILKEKKWSQSTMLDMLNKKDELFDPATLSNIINRRCKRVCTIKQAKRIQEVFKLDIFY